MRTGVRVHLINLHGASRYRTGTVTLAMAMSVAVSLTVSVTVTVSVPMSETLNRSARRMKQMIPTVRGGTVGGRLLLRLRRMVMTPLIREPLPVHWDVLEESGAVLVVRCIGGTPFRRVR